MNKKMRELLAKIKEKNSQARNFQNEGKVDEAKQLIDEIKDLQTSYENEKALFEMERDNVPEEPKNKTTANGFSVMAKIALRKKLTEAENALVPTGLADFEDGDTLTEGTKTSFEQKKFQVTHKGKVFPISNILLESEKAGLTSYLNNWFVKNSIISENTDIFTALQNGKTAKAIKGLDELKSSINKDLDPSARIGAVIVTNQTGFDIMDSEN